MSAIGPGDFVECVKAYSVEGRSVELGRVYVIRECMQEEYASYCGVCETEHSGSSFVLTVDPINPQWGWCPTQFKPIYRRKESLITKLLEPVKDEELV